MPTDHPLPRRSLFSHAPRQLEERVRGLLGKPAALLFPTGTMAQQVALRVHADHRGRRAFAAHPQTHLANWEAEGYSVVHRLRLHPVGDRHRLLGLADLTGVAEPLAAVLWELPQRDLGGQLPSWRELGEQVAWARDRGAACHLDGARLWEAQPHYERGHAEIAGLFDTVYVSLYKGLQGVRGAVLAGDEQTIAQARLWRTRLGGNLPDAWPLAAVALVGLEDLLPRMAEFRDHARTLAAALNADGVARTVPEHPQTPLLHVHLPVGKDAVERAGADLLAERGVQLYGRVRSSPDPRACSFEITVGENALDFTVAEVVDLIRELVERARRIER